MTQPYTPAEFKAKASPAFDNVDDADVQEALDMAEWFVSEASWGPNRFKYGFYYAAAHYIVCDYMLKNNTDVDGNGDISGGATAIAAGVISMERIKSWAASYAVGDGSEDSIFGSEPMQLTAWGRKFLELRKLVFDRRCI